MILCFGYIVYVCARTQPIKSSIVSDAVKLRLFLSSVVIPELAANDQLMKFWMSIAKPDVSINIQTCKSYILYKVFC